MSDQFVGEIRILGCNFAPYGWAMCNGQIQSIAQNTALFSILGTAYGGNGQTTFALPNLQGAVALHQGQAPGLSNYIVGQTGGANQVTLSSGQLATHTHGLQAFEGRGAAAHSDPVAGDALTTAAGQASAYAPPTSSPQVNAQMNVQELGLAGGGGAHENRMPSLPLNYCIALTGIFPSRG